MIDKIIKNSDSEDNMQIASASPDEKVGEGGNVPRGTSADDSAEKPYVETESEKTARRQGWLPQEEFKGDSSNWRPAQEYIEHGKVIRESQINEVRDLKKSLIFTTKMLKDLVEERESEKAQRLTDMRREAIEASDVGRVDEIDKNLQDNLKKLEEIRRTPEQNTLQEWETKHSSWVNENTPENKKMLYRARMYGTEYEVDHPNSSPQDVLNFVEEKITQDYPHRFNKAAAPSQNANVGVSQVKCSAIPKKKGVYTLEDVPDKYRAPIKKFAADYKMDLSVYIKQLKDNNLI